jgi:uncharacterized protein (DUF4415 family)
VAGIERGFARVRDKLRRMPEMTEEEAARIHAGALSDPDAQPMTDEQLSRMRPLYQVHPEFVAKWLRRKRGRPTLPARKQQVTLRLDQDVVEHFRSTGPGWQTRINDALRKVAEKKRAGKR